MGTSQQPQDTRKRDEENRADKADMTGQGVNPPSPDEPAEQDESGKTAGPKEPTGLSPRPLPKPKPDLNGTSDE